MIGRSVARNEDSRLLRGLGRFGDDVATRGELWVRVVRSPVAHGELRAVDTAEATAMAGVCEVRTARDLPPDAVILVRLDVQGIDLGEHLQPVLARDRVRYVGEPVAVVVATDPYTAEDAAELVALDIAELPVALDAEQGTVAADFELGFGATGEAFERAAHVVELDFDIGRHSAVPMEPRTLRVDVDPATGALEIHGMTKVPVFNQGVLAGMLGIDEAMVRVHACDAGGGFGVRGEFYPEDFLVPWLAHTLRRRVRWTEDRAEHLVAVNHSRQQHHRISAAFDADGHLLALRDEVLHDNGAYCRTHGVIVPELTLAMLPGPYRVPAFHGRITVSLTNKTPCGTYRAPGRFEGTTAREQLLDVAAGRLGIDRVELRRRNLLGADELPHRRAMSTLGTDVVLDAGDYPDLLAKAIDRANELGYDSIVDRGRACGKRMGLGVGMFLEKSGLGPYDTADVSITSSGRLCVHSGGTNLGQGIETALAQIAAEVFDLDPADAIVVGGDTLLQPFGTGSWASRSTVVAGSAVHLGALEVRARVLEMSARMLEADADDLELSGGRVCVRGVPDRSVTLAEVYSACRPSSGYLRPDEPAGLSTRHRFETEHMTYPYGAHICVVEVDEHTGRARVLRYLVAYEVGYAINPAMVAGQLRGGVAQGVGGALLEEFGYDDAGQPQAVTFMDYRLPTAAEIPEIDVLLAEDAPSPGNPLGTKGAGEGGVTGAGAALASGVRDALGIEGSVGRLPMTAARVRGLFETPESPQPQGAR